MTEQQLEKIKKRLPADLSLEIEDKEGNMVKTFLTNKKNCADIYAYLLERSVGGTKPQGQYIGETLVKKKDLGSIKSLYEKFKISKTTWQRRMKEMEETGYIVPVTIDGEKYYHLPRVEEWYFEITLKTLSFFVSTLQDHVIKTYIYLGRKFEIPNQKNTFTLVELGEHTGLGRRKDRNALSNSENYKILWYDLYFLQKIGLIDVEQQFKENMPYFYIHNVSKDIDKTVVVDRQWTKQTGEDVAEAVSRALKGE